MITDKQQRAAAAAFAKKWEGRGYEKGGSQLFWTELLIEVYGMDEMSQLIPSTQAGHNGEFIAKHIGKTE